jgi:alkaline phosphatase
VPGSNGDAQNEIAKSETENSEPGAFYTKSALNTVDDVVAFGTGPGTEMLHGCIDNTQIFKIIRDEL